MNGFTELMMADCGPKVSWPIAGIMFPCSPKVYHLQQLHTPPSNTESSSTGRVSQGVSKRKYFFFSKCHKVWELSGIIRFTNDQIAQLFQQGEKKIIDLHYVDNSSQSLRKESEIIFKKKSLLCMYSGLSQCYKISSCWLAVHWF